MVSTLVVSMLVRGLHSRTLAEITWKKSVNGRSVSWQPPAPMGAITAASSAIRAYANDTGVEASASQGGGPASAAVSIYFSA